MVRKLAIRPSPGAGWDIQFLLEAFIPGDAMPTEPTEIVDTAALRRLAPAPLPNSTVLFTHAPDGIVTASACGVSGVGGTEDEALIALRWKLAEPARDRRPAAVGAYPPGAPGASGSSADGSP